MCVSELAMYPASYIINKAIAICIYIYIYIYIYCTTNDKISGYIKLINGS